MNLWGWNIWWKIESLVQYKKRINEYIIMNYNLNSEIFGKNKIQTFLYVELILAKVLKKEEDLLINSDNTIRKYEILNFNKLLSRRKRTNCIHIGLQDFWNQNLLLITQS